MSDTRQYTYRVERSIDDREFVATVDEIPSLEWSAAVEEDALAGITDLVRECGPMVHEQFGPMARDWKG
ncbi:hypothetical protein RE9425_03410 [Prescottella equi]|nr:hypothetical protein RE9425_03410 [Prescottella equi]